MLPQENLKFSPLRMQLSYILRAPQAIQTHKQHLLRKYVLLGCKLANKSIIFSRSNSISLWACIGFRRVEMDLLQDADEIGMVIRI